MKPHHLIAIIVIGTGLVTIAPTAEKAGQADTPEVTTKPLEDVKVIPMEISRVSLDGETEKLKDANN